MLDPSPRFANSKLSMSELAIALENHENFTLRFHAWMYTGIAFLGCCYIDDL
jgi:hypothetical protein